MPAPGADRPLTSAPLRPAPSHVPQAEARQIYPSGSGLPVALRRTRAVLEEDAEQLAQQLPIAPRVCQRCRLVQRGDRLVRLRLARRHPREAGQDGGELVPPDRLRERGEGHDWQPRGPAAPPR